MHLHDCLLIRFTFALSQGYALLEFSEYDNAKKAIDELNGQDILGQKIKVDWAFVKPSRRV